MIQRLTCLLAAVAFAMPAVARAQTAPVKHPDFTGSWRVIGVELPQGPAGGFNGGDNGGFGGGRGGGRGFGGGGRRGGGNRGGGGANAGGGAGDNGDTGARANQPLRLQVGQTFRVRQTDDRLIVTEEGPDGPAMSSYSFDGKETTNTTGAMTSKSKTKWEGVALVTDSTRTMDTGRGKFEIKTREVRSLSEDGQTMTVMTTLDTGRGKQTTTATLELVGG